MAEAKRCSKCDTYKNLAAFGSSAGSKAGIHAWCKLCVAEYSRTPKQKSRRAEWKRNKRRADPDWAREQDRRSCAKRNADPRQRALAHAYQKQYYQRTKEQQIEYARSPHAKLLRVASTYRISRQEAARLLSTSRCAICSAAAKVIDHDHGTDAVRGRLCRHCNVLLGMAKDNTGILQNAIAYLQNPPFSMKAA